jgi:hypothetical protein
VRCVRVHGAGVRWHPSWALAGRGLARAEIMPRASRDGLTTEAMRWVRAAAVCPEAAEQRIRPSMARKKNIYIYLYSMCNIFYFSFVKTI